MRTKTTFVATALMLALCCVSIAQMPHPEDFNRDITAQWQRNGKTLITNFNNMYNLHVIKVKDKSYPYRGWFFGWATADLNRSIPGYTGGDAIFAARAKTPDGPWEIWSHDNVWDGSMTASLWRPCVYARNLFWDSWHNGDPSVVFAKGKYYMVYTSTGYDKDGYYKFSNPADADKDIDGAYCCVAGAVSADGVNWKQMDAPLMTYAKEYGALGVDPLGEACLMGMYARPSIMFENGKFRLWFDYFYTKGISMGYAECKGEFTDPKQWKLIAADENPALIWFPNPDMVRVGKLLFAYGDPSVEGIQDPWRGRKFTEAVSIDGLKWKVLGHINSEPEAPAVHVPEAYVEKVGKNYTIYLYYATQIGGAADGASPEYNYRYDKIRVMRRTITSAEIDKLYNELKKMK